MIFNLLTMVSKRVAEIVDSEKQDKTKITQSLFELQTKLDLGQISEKDYSRREKELLENLDAIENEIAEGEEER
ncbi:MAG: gas vesicle protein GvpG [Negativicutes bacterium]